MQFGDGVRAALPVSSILRGFLFAGFWWTLNRELTFRPEERHFKLGIGLQLVGMVMLAVFGVVLPMRALADAKPGLLLDYRGVVLALIVIFGYMLTDLATMASSSGRNTQLDPRSCFARVLFWWSSR
ncbi:MAG: hypothetical protein ACLP00_08210 [Terracidiphilus sp.]